MTSSSLRRWFVILVLGNIAFTLLNLFGAWLPRPWLDPWVWTIAFNIGMIAVMAVLVLQWIIVETLQSTDSWRAGRKPLKANGFTRWVTFALIIFMVLLGKIPLELWLGGFLILCLTTIGLIFFRGTT